MSALEAVIAPWPPRASEKSFIGGIPSPPAGMAAARDGGGSLACGSG